jgi:endonuclease YncB( thermonuclease family)
MGKTLGLCAALVALAAGIGVVASARHSAPAPETAVAGSSVVPASFAAVLPDATAESAPPAPPPTLARRGANLPSVEVKPHIVHDVPDDDATLPARPVTLHKRDGRLVVENSAPVPALRPRATKVAINPATLGGAARTDGGASLSVAGRTVHLFGVRAAERSERCAASKDAALSCSDAARAALTARLGGTPSVSCTMPPGQGGDPGYICRDAAGVDLGGLLVAQGLALADRGSSYQYVGAEETARAHRSGLWR